MIALTMREAEQHIYNEVAKPMRYWERLGDSTPLETKIAQLHREGYTFHQIAAGARLAHYTVIKMNAKGEIHLQRQVEREIRDRLIFEE